MSIYGRSPGYARDEAVALYMIFLVVEVSVVGLP